MARGLVARRLTALGGKPVWRDGFVTDNGNQILDVANLDIIEPAKLESGDQPDPRRRDQWLVRASRRRCSATRDGQRCRAVGMNETPSMRTGQRKGRGAISNKNGRFEDFEREQTDDGWGLLEQPLAPLRTRVEIDSSKTIVSHNDSPDIPFTSSINPYRGCEHGCIYCFARPTHTYLGLSAGMDFETRFVLQAERRQTTAHLSFQTRLSM